jgi:hypothetical protein
MESSAAVQRTSACGGTSQQWRRVSYVRAPRAEGVKVDWEAAFQPAGIDSTPNCAQASLAKQRCPVRCQVGRNARWGEDACQFLPVSSAAARRHAPGQSRRQGRVSACVSRAPCDADTTPASQPAVHAMAACRQHLQSLAQPSLGLDLCHGNAAEQWPDATKCVPFPWTVARTRGRPLSGANLPT